MNNEISKLAAQCVNKLIEKNITIATAESCTGGMFSSYLTNVPGVSAIYEFGITSYSNRIKSRVLGVDAETLMEYGAVSHQTAKEMAIKIRKLAPANIGVSITGEAGPSSSEGKAPGTVYIAISDENMTYIEKLEIEPISREYVRQTAVKSLFSLLLKYLERGLEN